MHVPSHTEIAGCFFHAAVLGLGLFHGHAVLLGEQFGEGLRVVVGGVGVELEGAVVNLNGHCRIESFHGQFELALAEIAEGADHIAPDIDS